MSILQKVEHLILAGIALILHPTITSASPGGLEIQIFPE
jgi:hypothetical protein